MGTSAAFEGSPMPNQLEHVETRFGNIAYRASGEGGEVPLLLLQRFRGTLDDWDPDFVGLLETGRRIIRLDNAGIGGSSGDVPETLDGMAEVVVAFLDAMDLPRVDILGWSLGGIIAQHVALNFAQRVRRLVVAGSGPGGVDEGPEPHPKVRETMGHAQNGPEDYLFLFFADSDRGRAAGLAYLERLAGVTERVPAVTGSAFMGQLKAIQSLRGLRQRLPELSMPLLVANGMRDVMIPAYRSYVIASEAPDAKLILYPDSGHAFLFQHAEDFAGEVHRFLDVIPT
jgi:pimeloyl-ACP methyl ester carboxylesterase